MEAPQVANRDCDHCKKWMYDETTGKVEMTRNERGLRIIPVERHGPPPCELPQGCPKGSPDSGLELSSKNWRAYFHYRQCRAVGVFPNDDIVKKNADSIRHIEEVFERSERSMLYRLIAVSAHR